MTDYETQSLQIATDTYHVYWWADVIAAGALVAAIVGGFFAFLTLRKIAQQLESAKWNALLSFEQDMNARRQRFSDVAQKLTSSSEPTEHQTSYEEAKESYLNAVERLASSILKGQFPEAEMKTSYREYIASTIREYEDRFRAGTHYPRIIELHQKWRD
jgi:hypothetical protein